MYSVFFTTLALLQIFYESSRFGWIEHHDYDGWFRLGFINKQTERNAQLRPGCVELLAQYIVCNDVDPSSDAYVSELRVNVAKTGLMCGSRELLCLFGRISGTLVRYGSLSEL
jgi:hypothetical protein